MTANIETGEVVEAFDNQALSFPSFSTQDNILLFSAQDNNGTEVVASIELAEDGINVVNNSAEIVFSRAKWPVWYATGSRNLEGSISTSNNDLSSLLKVKQ